MAHIRVSVNDAQAPSLRSLCAPQNLPFIVPHIGYTKGGDNPRRKKFIGRTDFCDCFRSAPTGRRIITAEVCSRAGRCVLGHRAFDRGEVLRAQRHARGAERLGEPVASACASAATSSSPTWPGSCRAASALSARRPRAPLPHAASVICRAIHSARGTVTPRRARCGPATRSASRCRRAPPPRPRGSG